MKPFLLVVVAALSLPGMVFAQSTGPSVRPASAPSAAATPRSEGEVRKVDKEQGKITLKHGPLVNLDMPAMTMVFRVAEPKMLDAVKQGDKVKFTAANVNGALTITAIDVAK